MDNNEVVYNFIDSEVNELPPRHYKIGNDLYFDPVKPSRYSGEMLRDIRKNGQKKEMSRRLRQLMEKI